MKKIKPTAAAGKFYTDNKEELLSQLDLFAQKNSHDYDYITRAVIVPHAGYIYSGQLASSGIQYLNKNVKNVFVIGPPHYVPLKNAALSTFDKWHTPLGDVDVNQEINQELITKFGCEFEDKAFAEEHSVEVQIPLLQKHLSHFKIIPILAGHNNDKITKIITHYWGNPENAFVISSDLSHFHSGAEARKIDHLTAEMIETKNLENFNPVQACGSVGVCSLVKFAKSNKFSLIRVGLINSGDVTGDNSAVVGYGSWILYEDAKNVFIKKYFPHHAIGICKKSILAGLQKEIPQCEEIPEVFNETGACFVTLEKHGELRGCIGSIVAHRALIDDLIKNAQSAAFSDPRFHPLTEDEIPDLSINISLLSEPERMHFENEGDLLSQIRPFTDGIIIKERGYQAVYLPSVWEQLPEKTMFLNSLKMKAGLTPDYFSSTIEVYRFTTEYIKE